jgi:LysR family hydrogen peroxide-inducible transcriptional activator
MSAGKTPAAPTSQPSVLNLTSLTLAQLRYVVALDRHRSFRAAADSCHVTQPALSMQIGKLEEMCGFYLFDRSAQPIVPTHEGTAVVEQARAILREVDRFADVVRGSHSAALRGPYRLGVIPTLATSLVPALLPAFASSHPDVELIVEERTTEDLVASLLDGALDGGLAAIPLSVPTLRETPIYREPLYVYLAPGHPLSDRGELRQSDLVEHHAWLLAEGHCFRDQALHLCRVDRRSMGDGPRSSFEGQSFETLVRLVDAGTDLTILPHAVVARLPAERRAAQVRRFRAPQPARQIGFLRVREHLRRNIGDAIVDILAAQVTRDEASLLFEPEEVDVLAPVSR